MKTKLGSTCTDCDQLNSSHTISSCITLLSEFDKYYIINYREFGKSWKTLSEDKDDNDVSDSRSGTFIFTLLDVVI